MSSEITITRPDDWHLHLRDQQALERTVRDTARYMKRAIVMPNLKPPVTTTKMALDYYQRIRSYAPEHSSFEPLMTLYLTDRTSKEEIAMAASSKVVHALKLYPAGATTNSDAGVTDIASRYGVFEEMAKLGLKLLIHGEVTHEHTDIFDRERIFIETTLQPLVEKFPELKIVFEHITTKDAVQFVQEGANNIAATITAHHLLFNRNHMLAGGIRPHFYCLPILKRSTHQEALIEAATSGEPKFFLGTDSAPHSKGAKESACGCAGSYTSFAAIELYATAFERANALDKLEGFASHFGPDFYGLPRNQDQITLKKKSWRAPESLTFAGQVVIPLMAGEEIHWSVESNFE